ncbi:GIY-YIG nuclease family protein [Alteromonas sp. ALT199]|uniref:GIY-YIG nuclease family protein n=1 Tax=unclassified Alteromonas TaxID=2614992 RepID=UPI00046D62AD|nr:GIY-YIG nuclease family protein [Alteromonas sp. ALT199]
MAQSITAKTGNTHQLSLNTLWYLYMVENKLGQIYTGITTDPKRRIAQHRGQLKGGAKALKGKSPLIFRAVFEVADKAQAAKLEYAVKQMSRLQKDRIIQKKQLNELLCVKSTFED